MPVAKILMLVGDYVEDYEAMVPFQMLQLVGHDVHAVCPEKKSGDKVRTAVHDFTGAQTYDEVRGHNFALNHDFDAVKPEDYDGLVLPGGRAPEYLRTFPKILEITEHFIDKNKPIYCICHGIQILTACKGLKGRTVTCYPACATEVTLAGATFKKVDYHEAVVDGNLATAPAWPAHAELMKQFLKLLGTGFTSSK